MYGIDDEEFREELRRIDTANKENALCHIKQALGYSNCEVTDMELVHDGCRTFVDITFRSGAVFRANVSMDSVGAMIYDIFKQCEWLRA